MTNMHFIALSVCVHYKQRERKSNKRENSKSKQIICVCVWFERFGSHTAKKLVYNISYLLDFVGKTHRSKVNRVKVFVVCCVSLHSHSSDIGTHHIDEFVACPVHAKLRIIPFVVGPYQVIAVGVKQVEFHWKWHRYNQLYYHMAIRNLVR